MALWAGSFQWTMAAPSQPSLRLYRWTHPTCDRMSFIGLVLWGRELRLWRIDGAPRRPWSTESEHFEYGRRRPSRLRQWLHRLRFRRWYALLPAFYQDFYPFDRALGLTLHWAKHTAETGREMDRLASQNLRRVNDLERTISELRLALAMAGLNEDQVDRFMGTWFRRHDLPTSAAVSQSGEGRA